MPDHGAVIRPLHYAPLPTRIYHMSELAKTQPNNRKSKERSGQGRNGVKMSSKPARIVAQAAGAVPALGLVASVILEAPWLALAALGFIMALVLVAAWLLCRQPFFEISETTQRGVRRRLWRAGIGRPSGTSPEAFLSTPHGSTDRGAVIGRPVPHGDAAPPPATGGEADVPRNVRTADG